MIRGAGQRRQLAGPRTPPVAALSDMTQDYTLDVSGLTKTFGPTRALWNVTHSFRQGNVYAILGENGSGKSTFVKVLSGVHRPDSGRIAICGREVRARSPRDMIALGIAVVLQEVLVAPNRPVKENIFLGHDGAFRIGNQRIDENRQAHQVLSEITDRQIDMERPAAELPLHERQLVVIARGFARRPDVLILDEVTASLDLADRNKLFEAIRRYKQKGGLVLFVSHRIPEIVALADFVIILRNGEKTATLEGESITAERLLSHLAEGEARV